MSTTPSLKERTGLPDGWKPAKLGDICEITMGTSPPGHTYNRDGIGELLLNGPTEFGPRYPVAVQWTTKAIRFAEPGDILFCVRGATTGRKNIADQRYCIGRGLAAIRGRGGLADTDFLWYVLDVVTSELVGRAAGSTFVNLPGAELNRFHVPLPPLAEQKRIAGILKEQLAAVDRARAAAEAQLEAAKSLPAAYLRDVFDGDEAQNWPTHAMGKLSTLIIDGPHVTPVYQTSGVPFLTVRNIVNRRIDMTDVSYVSGEDHAEFAARGRAERGDILYTKDGTLGVPCIVDTDERFSFFVSVALIKLKRDVVDPYFVAYALESPAVLKQVERLGAGAGLKHMVLRSIRALIIPVPSLVRQQEIARSVRDKIARSQIVREALDSQLQDINALPAALLRSAFQGQL